MSDNAPGQRAAGGEGASLHAVRAKKDRNLDRDALVRDVFPDNPAPFTVRFIAPAELTEFSLDMMRTAYGEFQLVLRNAGEFDDFMAAVDGISTIQEALDQVAELKVVISDTEKRLGTPGDLEKLQVAIQKMPFEDTAAFERAMQFFLQGSRFMSLRLGDRVEEANLNVTAQMEINKAQLEQIDVLRDDCTESRNEAERAKVNTVAAKSELRMAKNDMAHKDREITSLTKELQTKTSYVSSVERQRDRERRDKEQREATIRELQNDINSKRVFEDMLEEMKQTRQTSSDVRTEQFNVTLASIQASINEQAKEERARNAEAIKKAEDEAANWKGIAEEAQGKADEHEATVRQLEKLQIKYDRLDKQLQDLQRSRDNHQAQSYQDNATIQTLGAQVERLQQEAEKANQERDDSRTAHLRLASRQAGLYAENKQQAEEIKNLKQINKQQSKDGQTNLRRCMDQIAPLQKRVDGVDKMMREQKEQRLTFAREISDGVGSQLKAIAEAQSTSSAADAASLGQQFASSTEALRTLFTGQLDNLEAQYTAQDLQLQQRVEELQKGLSEIKDACVAMQTYLEDSIPRAVEATKSSIDEHFKQHNEQLANLLSNSEAAGLQRHEEIKKEVRRVNSEMKKHEEKQQQEGSMRQALTLAKTEIERLMDEGHRQQENVELAQNERDEARANAVAVIAEREALKTRTYILEKEVLDGKLEVKRLEASISGIKTAAAEGATAQVTQMAKQLGELNGELRTAKEENAALGRSVGEAQEEVASLRADVEAAQKEMDEEKLNAGEWQERNKQANQRIITMDRQIGRLDADLTRYRTNIEAYEGNYNALMKEYEKSQQENETLQRKSWNELSSYTGTLNDRLRTIHRLKTDNHELQAQLKHYENMIRQLNGEVETQKADADKYYNDYWKAISEQTAHVQTYQAQSGQLNEEMRRLRDELTERENDISALQKSIGEKDKELRASERKLKDNELEQGVKAISSRFTLFVHLDVICVMANLAKAKDNARVIGAEEWEEWMSTFANSLAAWMRAKEEKAINLRYAKLETRSLNEQVKAMDAGITKLHDALLSARRRVNDVTDRLRACYSVLAGLEDPVGQQAMVERAMKKVRGEKLLTSSDS